MQLERNKEYNTQMLAAFLEIKPISFTNARAQKLEELKDYADFDVITTEKGYFKCIHVTEVYCATYCKEHKKELLDWLKWGDRWAETGEGGCSNATVITNFFCSTHDIEYDGPHFIYVEDEGRSEDGKRKISQMRKTPNPAFSTWHYLYRIVRNFYVRKGYPTKEYIDMSAGAWNPTHLKLTTAEMQQIREGIYDKYYGKASHQDLLDVVDYIEDCKDTVIAKADLLNLKAIAKMTDKEKRSNAANECVAAGVLKRRGYNKNAATAPQN